MAYQLAICDDEKPAADYVAHLVERWMKSRSQQMTIDFFDSAESLWLDFSSKKYDLLLLDIEMAAMDGVTLAKKIRHENKAVQIVFITGYSDYIAEGYEVAALHYLLKPLDETKFFQVLDRAVATIKDNRQSLTIQAEGEIVVLPFYEIHYLEVDHNYVTVHAKTDVTTKQTLSEIAKNLDARFFRCHRSFIVNLMEVAKVTKTEVHLQNGARVPLSRGNYEKINRALIEYL